MNVNARSVFPDFFVHFIDYYPAWIHQFSEVKIDDETILTAKQIKELQKRNAQLEEENLILKKAIAIFTPHSSKE